VPTLYFTFGRGPWLALGLGLFGAIALDPRRVQLVSFIALVAPAAALAVWIGSRSPALTRQQSRLADAAHDGHRLALVVAALAAASALLVLVAARLEHRIDAGRRVRRAYAGVVLLAAVALLAALFVRFGGPVTLARHAYAEFKGPPVGITAPGSNLNKRLFSLSGNGRPELWGVALDDYQAHRWRGSGAGTYERYWLAHRARAAKVRDAHGLYIETLAELGPIGLALLVIVLAVPISAAVRARRAPLVPAAAGAYIAFVAHAGVDWDWEMSAVTLTAVLCGGALLAAARAESEISRISTPMRLSIVGVLVAVGTCSFVALVGNARLAASDEAIAKGDGAKAEREARAAKRWAPWSVDPLKALAQAQLVEDDRAAARATLRRAIAKDPRDWDLWYRLALASDGPTFRQAIAAATRLNPFSPEIAALRSARRKRS
jgi:O-Antigen ligase